MTGLKSLMLRTLPDPLLARAKRLRYPGVIRKFRPAHADVLRAVMQPGDQVLDIGANIGWYTHTFSNLVGPEGRVFSVEPVPPTFELLTYCVRRLGLRNVELFNYAMSDQPGSATMEVPRYSEGGENFYAARIVGPAPSEAALRTFTVPIASIDELLGPRLTRLTFVKCDVEGHELRVLRGARATLARSHPLLLVEIGGDPDDPTSAAHTVVAELGAGGYAAYRFDGRGLARRQVGQRAVDYFFLTEPWVARLRGANVPVA
jgi:FkbM family methyltransferase